MEDIFELENEIILEAENLIQMNKFVSVEDEGHYKKLLMEYKKLLKQMRTMVKMSDIMQSKLNTMSTDMEKLSQIDALTGLYNRRYFNEVYQKAWRNAVKESTALGVMMIDIDYFKVYNDTFGHLEGDTCLQKIANSIQSTVENFNAMAGRFGGEEFIVLLSGADKELCTELAQKIMEDIALLNIPCAIKSANGNVTVSIGIGLMTPTEDMKLDSLINIADQALYLAKKEGRNCWRM